MNALEHKIVDTLQKFVEAIRKVFADEINTHFLQFRNHYGI